MENKKRSNGIAKQAVFSPENFRLRDTQWFGMLWNQKVKGDTFMGVSKNNGTPKWMVKIMENPIKMDDLGVPLFLETPL